MAYGDEPVKSADRSSLQLIGTVGEPINQKAWLWLHDVVGERRAAICDTYWQTETGSHVSRLLARGLHTTAASSDDHAAACRDTDKAGRRYAAFFRRAAGAPRQ